MLLLLLLVPVPKRQLVEAALGLNSVGVAHHDITPGNVMIQAEKIGNSVYYRATLVDLGTATILAVSSAATPIQRCSLPCVVDEPVYLHRFVEWREGGLSLACCNCAWMQRRHVRHPVQPNPLWSVEHR